MWNTILRLLSFLGSFLNWKKWRDRAKDAESKNDLEKQTDKAENAINHSGDSVAPPPTGNPDDLLNSDKWNKRIPKRLLVNFRSKDDALLASKAVAEHAKILETMPSADTIIVECDAAGYEILKKLAGVVSVVEDKVCCAIPKIPPQDTK
jgi:hypothetical protein